MTHPNREELAGRPCGCCRCVNEAVKADGGSPCDPRLIRMFLCERCKNKRCPHATDHRLSCTGSNEPGQEGSNYGVPLAGSAAALRQSPTVEEVARVIDPEAYEDTADEPRIVQVRAGKRQREAEAKAQAIAALYGCEG